MTTPTSKPKTGRPQVWPTKISAPPEALQLYELVASLQHSTAFKDCHPYEGAKDKRGIPMFKFEGRVHSMPFIISSFMGIEYGKRNCETPGCVNPFHYAPPSERITPDQNQFLAPPPQDSDSDLDLLDYYVEDMGVQCDFTSLRPRIPAEDISDANLRAAILKYRSPK